MTAESKAALETSMIYNINNSEAARETVDTSPRS
jgi:hypothetical protein